MTQPMIVKCPTCSEAVAWTKSNDYKPFCSKRCKLIDLGEWASESHKIAGQTLDPHTVSELAKEQD
ncbi:DNA gyrase inhibitor YacG [Kangiella sediminilitoris]|uniref:DNA gyrase inhibitor YacG n=1 Tax=Kangiella sediminilitoris TaxID=1144748 RepID=A0A1B3BCB9_9GAMM|nr:DNA gyrase inhibitor YacG [Kangiella sediminilitoris]AOE50454.1 DNA gyrase inhibitor [Kangiella sediminilitoris]